MGAMPMIVSAIAGGANTRVVWGAFDTASTDGRLIRMPLLPLEDEHVEAYALGYAVHETGHVVDTDFTVDTGTGLAKSLFFILEDARIELNRMRCLPGARRWLENLAYALLRDGRIGTADADAGVPNKLCSYLLTHVWAEVLGFHGLREAAARCRALLADALPHQVFSLLEAIAFEVQSVPDTAGAKALAVRMMEALQQLADDLDRQQQPGDQEQDQPQGGQQPGDEQGDQEQDQPQGGQQPGDEQGDQQQDQPQGGQQPGDEQRDQQQHQPQSDERKDGQQQVDPVNPTEDGEGAGSSRIAAEAAALAELLGADECPEGADIGERIAAGLGDALKGARGKQNDGSGGFTSAPDVFELRGNTGDSSLIREIRRESLAVRARLDEFVQVETRARKGNARSGQHLARDAGLRLASHDYAIYERARVAGKKVDTAFLLLMDVSYSMLGHKVAVARRAGLAMAVALEEIPGVKLAVYAFGGDRGHVLRVIRYGESVRRCAGRFREVLADGTTPMAEALMVAHADILGVDAERRIVVVETDGEPDDENAVHQMVRFGERHGIEHIGLGIGNDAKPSQFFRNSRNIGQVDELPRALVAIAQANMFKNRLAA